MPKLRFRYDPDDEFYRVLKSRVDDYLARSGRSRFADAAILAKALFFAGLIVGSYTLILLHPFPLWTLLPLAFVYGAASLLLAINIGHEAAHYVLFRSRFWNEIAHDLCFFPLGVSAYLWRLRHTRSHHVLPNVNGCDNDIDENPFLRLSPNQPWRPRFRYQHLYAPLAYLFVGLHTILWQDFEYLFQRRLANLSDIEHSPRRYLLFCVYKVAYFVAVLGVPMAVLPLPWWQVLLGYLAMYGAASLLFVFLLIGTHFSDVTEFPAVGEDGSVGRTWARHALATACDWGPHSWLAHFVVGGVNAHATHHLFPGLSHTHYRTVAGLVESTAAEFGVRYNRLSLLGLVRSHFRFLRKLGQPPSSHHEPLGYFATPQTLPSARNISAS